MVTSYYARIDELKKSGLHPIGISRSLPRGLLIDRYIELAPTWGMIKLKEPEYRKQFDWILDKLDPESVLKDLIRISGRKDDKEIVILCYESSEKFCHRHIVAKWLQDSCGISAQEYK